MPKSPRSEQEFLRVRAIARQILVEHGAAFAAGTAAVQTTEEADDAIGDLVKRYQPMLEGETDRIVEMIADADVARQMSDHHGAIMAAYGDAGYFFGVCAGLELASIVLGQRLAVPARAGKKGGRLMLACVLGLSLLGTACGDPMFMAPTLTPTPDPTDDVSAKVVSCEPGYTPVPVDAGYVCRKDGAR